MKFDYSEFINFVWETITFETFIKFVVVYFFVVWIALIVWVIKDIGNRTESILLQIVSVLIMLFLTPLGLFIYLIIRPGKTLFEKYYNEVDENLEIMSKIIEDKTKRDEELSTCFKCDYPISPEFKFCPDCKEQLKANCKKCNKIIFSGWDLCPYCGDSIIATESKEKEELKDKKIEKKLEIIKQKENIEEEISEIKEDKLEENNVDNTK